MATELIIDTTTLRNVASSIEEQTKVMNAIIGFMDQFGKNVAGLTQEQVEVAKRLTPFDNAIQADRERLKREVEALNLASAQFREATEEGSAGLVAALEHLNATVNSVTPSVQAAVENLSARATKDQQAHLKAVNEHLEAASAQWGNALESVKQHVDRFVIKHEQGWDVMAKHVNAQLHAFSESADTRVNALTESFGRALQEAFIRYDSEVEGRLSTRIREMIANFTVQLNELMYAQDQRLEDALGQSRALLERTKALEREAVKRKSDSDQVILRFEDALHKMHLKNEELQRNLQATLLMHDERLRQHMDLNEQLLQEMQRQKNGKWYNRFTG